MNTTFKTKQDAINAGFRPVDRKHDTDISGQGYFGYGYQDADGNTTVDVWLTDEINRIGNKGAMIPMYPPTNYNTAAATLGRMTSERKAQTSRENGKKGGRPREYNFTAGTFSVYRDDPEYRELYRAACRHYGYKAQVEGGWKFWEFATDYETWKRQK